MLATALAARESLGPFAESLLGPQQPEQVGTVGVVEHGEVGRQSGRRTELPQQPVGDRVKRAAPHLLGELGWSNSLAPAAAFRPRRDG